MTLQRLLAARPSAVEVDVGLARPEEALVVAHDVDFADGTGLTLEQVLAVAGPTQVVVEAKCAPPSTPSPRAFARALAPHLRSIALCSFDERVLFEARRLRPSVATTFLFSSPLRMATAAETIGPRHDLVTRQLVDSAHRLGLRVVPWTVNDVPAMVALVELGVDGLVTDEPLLAREVARGRLAIAA